MKTSAAAGYRTGPQAGSAAKLPDSPIAKLGVQIFQDSEIAVPSLRSELVLKMTPEVILHSVVVKQGVVHVKQ
jgi:hypothetical protein